ncbi:MAG TPA: GntR family transcriptional regulator [Anaerolineaceae bacterium]
MYHFAVDKASSRPIYLQIRDQLLAAIEVGLLQPGQKIPSARDLSEQMDVSRMTVLQALRDLTQQGHLYSVAGKGTFVSIPEKLDPNLRSVWGFTETFHSTELRPSSQLVALESIPADQVIADALQVPEKTLIIRIARLRLLNQQPVGFETTHLAQVNFPGLETYDWNQESLYTVLSNRYGVHLVGGCNYIEALPAPETIARHLQIPEHTPVLATQRIACTADLRPVELVYGYYRGDRMRFKVDMVHDNPLNILTSKLDHTTPHPG